MGMFGTELQTAIKKMGWNQRLMTEKAAAFSQAQLSRYITGSNLPEMYTLEALCAVFPEEIRERLVMAYLLDQIPPSARDLVEIRPTGARSSQDVPVFGKAPRGSRLQRYLSALERLALGNPDFEKAIMYMVRSYEGLPLDEQDDEDEVKIAVPPRTPRMKPNKGAAPQS